MVSVLALSAHSQKSFTVRRRRGLSRPERNQGNAVWEAPDLCHTVWVHSKKPTRSWS